MPALLLEWRQTPDGWQGRVVRPVPDMETGVGAWRTKGNPDDYVFVRQTSGTWRRYIAPSAAGGANDVVAVEVAGRSQFLTSARPGGAPLGVRQVTRPPSYGEIARGSK